MWQTGFVTIKGHRLYFKAKVVIGSYFKAKVYDQPSSHGIAGGRVSKLEIRECTYDGWRLAYNRGWDGPDKTSRPAVQAVLKLFPVKD